ncbi:choice-of-anchor Q domain-containing protein [Aquimonas voraii]|uniref:Polymorphic outer membrane protein repeat-containing protein n=1 Tax=Aquimonas voraii TaxID=265719 RepID=A0A1G6XAL5_9GAMM|nr:choice-of-anchor Q domain-containing protein [Aquimonas voraii]SDD75101.1 hypothetical protein SAMN04488509_106126 [Aquimonas voraii]
MPRTLAVLLLALASLPAAADTFSVSNIGDDGAGSLRAAIVAANAAGSAGAPHRIEFTAAFPLNGEIELFTALPRINVVAEIDGNGRAPVLRPFDTTQDLRLLASSRALTLRRFTLQQGRADSGGCLASDGAGAGANLVLDRMRFAGCLSVQGGTTSAVGGAVSWTPTASVGVFESVFEANGAANTGTGTGSGGALSVTGPLLVQSSRFVDNLANGRFTSGAAIRWTGLTASTLEIRDSVFIGNLALPESGGAGFGGALAVDCPSCSVSVVRSYFGGNRAGFAGAIFVRGNNGEGAADTVLENTSFVDNRALGDGGALGTQGARLSGRHLSFFGNESPTLGAHLTTSSTQLVEWSNSAMAPKRAGSGNACAISSAAASTLGTLLAAGDNSCSIGLTGASAGVDFQVVGVDEAAVMPVLAFDPSSPAVDGANAARCLPTDARGVTRPQDGNGDGNAACDVGAFELQAIELFADGFED